MFSKFALKGKVLSKFIFPSIFSAYLLNSYKSKKAKNCGIIGYLGNQPMAVEVCLEGIQILQFRGYDSAGICTVEDNEFKITKYASDYFLGDDCIKQIAEAAPKIHKQSSIGIGHTRWATHGRKIAINAHPHVDFSKKIALVHNGIIDNYKEIKEFLSANNINLVSETDTEVIAQLVGYYYNIKKLNFKDSVAETIKSHLVGSFALAIINKDYPDKLIVARNGSPLLVGKGNDFFIVSSDVF
jgi:glucosamine--fructose-6-phosphate aminotransferase (isomerizing)